MNIGGKGQKAFNIMKSYIKFLSRNKLYTAIEAAGLALSLAFVILLGTYIWQQYRVINENPDSDRLYVFGTSNSPAFSTNEKLIFQAEPLPEIETMARYELNGRYPVRIDDELRFARAAMVDMEWFDIFPYYEIPEGAAQMLNDPNNVLVSQSFANTLGGPDEVIGKRITALSDEKEFVVAGIIQDFRNTLFQNSDILMNGHAIWPEEIMYFQLGYVYNFVKFVEGADIEGAEEKMTDAVKAVDPNLFTDAEFVPKLYSIEEAFFVPYSDLTNANETMLRVLVIIATALLISAVFNYVNLSFALVTKRAKEMATRRLVGAGRADILWKCILESVAFTVACFAAAVLLAIAFEPVLNSLLVGNDANSFVPIHIQLSFGYIAACLMSAVALGIIVGIIPAVSASAFSPVDVVKGAFRARSKMIFSKCFIVIQNVLAVILISMGILMEVQLSHMVNRPMNADTENLFYLESEFLESPMMAQPLYDALMENPDVRRVGFGDGFPGYVRLRKAYLSVEKSNGERVRPNVMVCDSTYFNMLNLNILEDMHAPLVGSLWLSGKSAAALQWDDNAAASIFGSRWNHYGIDHLGGIYKDVPAFLDQISNTVIEVSPWDKMSGCSLIIETVSESNEVRSSILKTYEEFSKECVGTVLMSEMSGFMSDLHMKMMAQNVRFTRLVEIFMVLAVLLSLMGLIAMSTYFSEQKSKEIAVRKVFGGTIGTETFANVRSYMIMVLIACVIGVPVAVWLSGIYLERFAYRIEGYWWIFLLAVLLSFAISLLSVLWQTLKAARTNPADELKKE